MQQSRRIMGYKYTILWSIQENNTRWKLFTTTSRATPSTFTILSSKLTLRNPINVLKYISDGLEALLQVNKCDYLVLQQLNIDRIQHTHKVLRCNVTQSMLVILQKDETKADLARCHHVALFSPVKSTLISELHNNHLTTWPGLNKQLINGHLGKSVNTSKGHLD